MHSDTQKKPESYFFLTVGRRVFPFVLCGWYIVMCEWVARGSLETFWTALDDHTDSFLLAWVFFVIIYYLVDSLFHFAPLSVIVTGLLAFIPGTVNFYTLKLRGEPFLPWDLAQLSEASGAAGAAGIVVQPNMIISAVSILLLAILSFFLYWHAPKWSLKVRLANIGTSLTLTMVMIFGVYLRSAATTFFEIFADPWMQDRYYRNYGVVSGFMTNLQNLNIEKPENYNERRVEEILEETDATKTNKPLFAESYAASAAAPEKTPTIIYVMNESYWDVTELEQYGIEFDTDISANFHRLKKSCAFGRSYSPSFGGGTCDVEFEALTGFSKEFLPAGSKPYQQHVTRPMFALPSYLRDELGYQTAAIHCFYAKYWSRDTAYPNLGMEDFVSLEKMTGLHERVRSYYWKSGLVSDADMGEQIIKKYEELSENSAAPKFIHAVTMQNHTNYNAANYTDAERVHILKAPEGIDEETLGALEDFATGVKAADDLLGTLTDYFSAVDEPVIIAYWGDHYNPINSNYKVYTETGYASGDSNDPRLHETTLMYWANYANAGVDIGSIAAYEITPVMMDLFGMDKPAFYAYLTRQFAEYRSRTCGKTVNPDESVSDELTEEQQKWSDRHQLLQYDLMFGKEYAKDIMEQ